MKNVVKIAGVIFVVNRLFTHITPATSLFSSIYFITEYFWQLLLVFGIASNGVSKQDKTFFLYLLPFFLCEFVYTALYWLGFINYHSTLEGFVFINIEAFLTFGYFVASQYEEIKSNWQKIAKILSTILIIDVFILSLHWLKYL